MAVTEDIVKRLFDAALKAREAAYDNYSNFAVGAALLAGNGEIYAGANIENASYGLTMCAERAAVGAAVTHGARKIEAILIVGGNRVNPDVSKTIRPCGACRQVLSEFMDDDGEVIMAGLDGAFEIHRLDDILPLRFGLEDC